MSKHTHTPGTWKTSPCSSGGLYVFRGKLGDPQYSVQIYPEQDAYLFAAAPDLLRAALIDEAFQTIGYTHKACRWLEEQGIAIEATSWEPRHLFAWQKECRRDALAKAKGER